MPQDQEIHCETVPSSYDRGDVPMKSQQHGCPSKTRTIPSTVVIPKMEESHQAPPLDEGLQATDNC